MVRLATAEENNRRSALFHAMPYSVPVSALVARFVAVTPSPSWPRALYGKETSVRWAPPSRSIGWQVVTSGAFFWQ